MGAPPPKKAKAVPPARALRCLAVLRNAAPEKNSPLRARLAAMEMQLEALKKGSDGGASQVGGAATGELAEAEDVCALANNCKGMSAREKLLALRGRCRGSRLKTYTNAYRAAWKSGEVLSDPEAVYSRIKAKHLVFGESREEREVRVDGEHASLSKGRLTGHQFEPLFDELEAVGLGKTPRELYLSYLRNRRRSGQTSGCGLLTRRQC